MTAGADGGLMGASMRSLSSSGTLMMKMSLSHVAAPGSCLIGHPGIPGGAGGPRPDTRRPTLRRGMRCTCRSETRWRSCPASAASDLYRRPSSRTGLTC